MSALFDELARKAQGLDVDERARLGQELLESVERDADAECRQYGKPRSRIAS
jgi:hypothetical protein